MTDQTKEYIVHAFDKLQNKGCDDLLDEDARSYNSSFKDHRVTDKRERERERNRMTEKLVSCYVFCVIFYIMMQSLLHM